MKTNMFRLSKLFSVLILSGLVLLVAGCSDAFDVDLPDSNSQVDTELPNAAFSYTQDVEEFRKYQFLNQASESTTYSWDFGTGATSEEVNPVYIFEGGEGTYTVTLTSSDDNGATSTISQQVMVVEPEEPDVPDPILVNFEFDKQAKNSGSDCACSAWINKSLGDQGESSSGNGGSDNVLKFDNNEPDAIYQEFLVQPNADYSIEIVTQFKASSGGSFPSTLETRVLAGAGYDAGYVVPMVYPATAIEFEQDDWGYTSIAQMEDPANNLLTDVQANPGDDDYLTYTYTFNAGANTSVAFFMRGLGGPATGGGGSSLGYNSGDEEIRIDKVIITAIN